MEVFRLFCVIEGFANPSEKVKAIPILVFLVIMARTQATIVGSDLLPFQNLCDIAKTTGRPWGTSATTLPPKPQ